jgi:radical SAM superfamily enzyme YgiQ (UPF0313 family)
MLNDSAPTRIAFASLKHKTAGKHSSFMPLAIGLIAAYAQKVLGHDAFEPRLIEAPEILEESIRDWRPDIIAFSHYCWNAELHYLFMQFAREMNPDVVCIVGGPEVPDPDWRDECQDFMRAHPAIDFFVYGEGEVPFADLVGRLRAGESVTSLKKAGLPGVMSIDPDTGLLLQGKRPPRLDLAEIPSPFVAGLFDHWFDGEHVPMVQLARGCPYQCAFCDAAQDWYSKVQWRGMPRIQEELTYIAERMKAHPDIMLAITDSNFGQYKHDIEVAHFLRGLQDTYGWPRSYDVTTGKSQHQRILETSDIMENRFQIYSSTQSFNSETLDIIKRRNLPMPAYLEVLGEIKKRGMETAADYIIPMPRETKQSFLDGIRIYIEKDVNLIVPLTLVMLKGVPLSSREMRETHGMQTRWRLVSRSIGEYVGRKVFEVEEVCIATNTMPFEDYLECRGFSFITIAFQDRQYDALARHTAELGISRFDFILAVWNRIRAGGTPLSDIYAEFMTQTEGELFPSRESIYERFSQPEEYAKLLNGEEGDNLLRRFRAKIIIDRAAEALDLAYDVLLENWGALMDERQYRAIEAARRWTLALRNLSPVFRDDHIIEGDAHLSLDFDVEAWYRQDRKPLADFAGAVDYRVWNDASSIREKISAAERMYGRDRYLCIPRILLYYDVKHFWNRCEPVDDAGRLAALKMRPDALAVEWKRENWVA